MSKFKLIAGPCVIESEENVMLIAEKVKTIAERLDLDYYYFSEIVEIKALTTTI